MKKSKKAAIIEKIKEAMKRNERLQSTFNPDSNRWHKHESVDDALFEALRLLGD